MRAVSPAPVIRDITTNRDAYPGGKIPSYEKLEITFQVDTGAGNLQLPYDEASPAGVQPGTGISVDALFTPDNWKTVYKQPAFYYQDFIHQVKGGKEWIYPSESFAWKVRFAPDEPGRWLFKLAARDAGGAMESPAYRFEVAASSNKGFLRPSRLDPRYFEYEDGTYFPALGYNMNFNQVSWDNPILENQPNFQAMQRNGIQLVRIWLSQWGIYGSSWSHWNSPDPEKHGKYIPRLGLTFEQAYPGSEVSMALSADENPCMFLGFMKGRPAVKRNTPYRVRIRYKTMGIRGPKEAGLPYGFGAKTGGWLWGEKGVCNEPGQGSTVTDLQSRDSHGWQILEGRLTTGEQDFLPYFYLVLENVTGGKAFIDSVWIEEDLGDGSYGPNIVSRSWMAHHLSMEQRNSYAFDKVLDLADMHDVYLRPVILEKNDWIFKRIDDLGNPVDEPGNDRFYGSGRSMTKVRWLQQAWWRYLQARWGYSTQIHSWELLNEGDPNNPLHYLLADEFGKYMHQFAPNAHMVSTSFWHSFPEDKFWANPNYPNVDFADIHNYVGDDSPLFVDTAQATYELSMQFGANQPEGAGKPVLRGEVAFKDEYSGTFTDQFQRDRQGVWLHSFVWGGINPGGMIESYWEAEGHIYHRDREGKLLFDYRPVYKTYYNFIRDIPLTNGRYQDAAAAVSNPTLRAWGQKDLRGGQAHLWIQNVDYTWQNVVQGKPIKPASGSVSLKGFQGGQRYLLEWWDTYQPNRARQIIRTESLTAKPDGSLDVPIQDLAADIAIKITTP